MKKTLCKVSSSAGPSFYLIQNDQNNLEVSANPENMQSPLYASVLVTDINNKYQNNFEEKFLSGEIFNDNTVSVLCNARTFKSLKDLLEKGLKIPQHQMPNIPNNHGHQMHNIAPVYNPQDRRIVRNTMDGRGYNRRRRSGWEGVNGVFNPCECGPCNIF